MPYTPVVSTSSNVEHVDSKSLSITAAGTHVLQIDVPTASLGVHDWIRFRATSTFADGVGASGGPEDYGSSLTMLAADRSGYEGDGTMTNSYMGVGANVGILTELEGYVQRRSRTPNEGMFGMYKTDTGIMVLSRLALGGWWPNVSFSRVTLPEAYEYALGQWSSGVIPIRARLILNDPNGYGFGSLFSLNVDIFHNKVGA